MSFTRSVLGNRHAIWAATIAVGIFGALAYVTLPVQLFPDTAPPLVNIITRYPGAAPEDVADELSRRLEEEFAALEGVVKVRSTSQSNLSMVSVEFRYERDADLAAVDVQNAIARVRGTLPVGIGEPQVLKFSTSDRPIATYGVTADDLALARQRAEDVFAPRLQQVPGVAAVDVFGGSQPAILIDVDRRALEGYGLSLPRVTESLRAHNIAAPAGRVRNEAAQIMFRIEQRSTSLEDLRRIPIATLGDGRIVLGDIATVREGSLEDDARFRLNGKAAIAMQIFKTTDANTVEVVRATNAVIADLNATYPSTALTLGEESATFTETSVDNLLNNVWEAIALTAILLFLFLRRWRISLLVAFTMPLSFGITFAAMKLLGIELNMVTLSAIILSVGIVVDDSVVLLENIMRRRDEDGLSAEDAAAEGTDEVRGAALGGVLTNLVVLVPLLFLQGFTQKTFGPLALTILLALVSSIGVALFLIPVLTLYTGDGGRLDRLALRVTAPFQRLVDGTRNFYVRLLGRALRRPLVTVGLALVVFLAGVLGLRGLGMDVLPKMDGGSFFVSLETPSGSSLDQTEKVVREVEAVLQNEPEVRLVQSQLGFEQGMRSFASFGVQGPTQGFVTVVLTDRTARDETIWSIEQRVRTAIASIPGIRTYTVRELGNTAKSTTSAPIIVRLSGPDPLVLDQLGDDAALRLAGVESVIQPTRSWRLDERRQEVHVDALRVSQLGLSPRDVGMTLLAGADGIAAGDYHGGEGSPLPMRMRYATSDRDTDAALLSFPVMSPTLTAPMPLRELVTVSERTGQGVVTREQLAPTLEVSAFIEGRPLSFVLDDVASALESLTPPTGYRSELTGERGDLNDAKGQIGGALAIAIVGVYLLLVAQFRSFLHPLTVLLSVPLSLVGVAGALFVTGKPLSLPVLIALILLVGTAAKNAILLVAFVEQRRAQGMALEEALIGAVSVRFRPILMTALSTVVGMIPLAAEWALGAERFSPLAIAVIGGLTVATFLTLIFVPVLYSVLDGWATTLGALRHKRATPVAAALLVVLALAMPVTARAEAPRPLELSQAIELALEHSPALAEQTHRSAATAEQRSQAVGRLLPKVSVSGRYSRVNHVEPGTLTLPLSVPPGTEQPTMQLGEAVDDPVALRAQLDQPLFTGFALTHAVDASRESEAMARERKRGVELDVRLRVAEAFYGLQKARALEDVAQRSVQALRERQAQTDALRREGRATDTDVARLQARVGAGTVSLLRAQGAAENARLALVTLLGLDASTAIELAELPAEQEPAQAMTNLDTNDVAGRPELRFAEHAAAAADAKAGVERASLWPTLGLRLGYSYDRPNTRYFPPKDRFDGSWDASLLLNWTAWDWGVSYHGAKAAAADARAAASAAEGVREAVALDVGRRRVDLDTQRARVAAAEGALASAELAFAGVSRLFDAGRLVTAELLDAEAELTQARAELVQARADVQIAAASLERALGVTRD